MHLADFSVGSLGESGIVGGGLPLATGAGTVSEAPRHRPGVPVLLRRRRGEPGHVPRVAEHGGVWRLPVVFLCENNRYAAPRRPARPSPSTSWPTGRRATACPGSSSTVRTRWPCGRPSTEAVSRARKGEGPTLVEAMTYRFREHAEGLRLSSVTAADEVAEEGEPRPDPLFAARLTGAAASTGRPSSTASRPRSRTRSPRPTPAGARAGGRLRRLLGNPIPSREMAR